jgi:hypothetical protein
MGHGPTPLAPNAPVAPLWPVAPMLPGPFSTSTGAGSILSAGTHAPVGICARLVANTLSASSAPRCGDPLGGGSDHYFILVPPA